MIFSRYKETCELLIDDPKIVKQDIKYYVEKSIRNLLHENMYVQNISSIAKFPGDGVKYISKLQSQCADMNCAEKLDTVGFSGKLLINEGSLK